MFCCRFCLLHEAYKMNLTIKKLPKSVQSLICASNQINSYTKAIQELVYNSLDADATSIAVRIHVSEGSIQVVDNGCGIPKADFKFIGQKYMTSKLVDISTLKSAPNKYGFQGQSLANLAQITKTLKVTSRFHKSETTCMKIFDNGKAQSAEKCSPRPSKGTTIEIKGFLHNLKIQKKSVSVINELQNIKTFLEHISLVHSKISISLRDDAKNEIVYKIHKNRDMYQTLSNLYEIDKTNVQELQVEKNQYKVKAYVGKHDVESTRHIIFVNGKIVPETSFLHKKLNENFKRLLRGGRKKIKKNQNNDDNENYIFGNKIPFYFLFITCPYLDYEMTNKALEFKDCGQINTLLDKLVKFYIGDVILTKVTPKKLMAVGENHESESTRNQIEKIMRKILGNHSKKPDICQMQNGIKGKLIKRKTRNLSKQKTDKSKPLKIKYRSPTSIDNNNYSCDRNVIQEPNVSINNSLTSKTQSILVNNSKINSMTPTSPPKTFKKASKTKYALSDKTKTPIQLRKNMNMKRDKVKRNKNIKKMSLHSKFAEETDSVKRRCEIVEEESRRLSRNNNKNTELFINENVHCTRRNFTENNKQTVMNKRVRETIIHKYIPIPTKTYTQRKNQDRKSFKSNYDLLQTIICSQITESNLRKDMLNTSVAGVDRHRIETENKNNKNTDFNNMTSSYNTGFLQRTLNNYVIQTPEQNFRPFLRKPDIQSVKTENIEIPHKEKRRDLIHFNEKTLQNIGKKTDCLGSHDNMNGMSSPNKFGDHSQMQTESYDSHDLAKTPEDSPFPRITYQSHNYDQNLPPFNTVDINYKKSRRFITTQSRENFMLKTNFNLKNNFKRNKTKLFPKLRQLHSKKTVNKPFNIDNNTKSISDSYTIEFTESNDHGYTPMNRNKRNNDSHYSMKTNNYKSFDAMTQSIGYIFNNFSSGNKSSNNLNSYYSPENNKIIDNFNYEPVNENTYTLTNSCTDHVIDMLNHGDWENNETYTIERSRTSNNESNKTQDPDIRNTENQALEGKDFVFLSKSVEKNIDAEIVMNPIDICEYVLTDSVLVDKSRHFETSVEQITSLNYVTVEEIGNCSIIYDSLNIHFPNYDFPDRVEQTQTKRQEYHIDEEISHHFTIPDSIISEFNQSLKMTAKAQDERTANTVPPPNNNLNREVEKIGKKYETVAFNLKNRLFFVPKGMSPIFQERPNKQQHDFNPIEEYYEDEIYNNFVDKVHNDVEIFQPRLDDRLNLTTKNIRKVNDKLHKNNASLKFDAVSIKMAHILGQVDSKFIAATIKSKSSKDDEEFLVLFDQHAVHERIRLENNLADYVSGNQWKSVEIDEITFKMSRDNIIYLHNYRDKFTQFGLEWTIPNYNEISVTAIPEGILGKNPRPVEKIIAAVKNLIAEEISVIQMQGGCVSMYPKSIMDLVFSEACRYAIKFGDHLSKSQCVELLNSLSDCKTSFQCAHGRPAMAVIMNIEKIKYVYKADFLKLQQFKNG